MAKGILDKDFEREHPSYGMMHISRGSNSCARRLFGSALDTHYNTIRITIGRATWYHNLNEDRYYGNGKEHIEVEMSAAQFAEAITSLNIGSGTPCTIRYVGGKSVEEPPNEKTETQHVKDNFKNNLGEYVERMNEYRKEVEVLTASLPAKKRDAIGRALGCMVMQLESNIPFVLGQFEEATSRVVTSAKAEVEAFTTNVLRSAGIEAIAKGNLPALLGAGKEDEE